jgi:hypothetical protein
LPAAFGSQIAMAAPMTAKNPKTIASISYLYITYCSPIASARVSATQDKFFTRTG